MIDAEMVENPVLEEIDETVPMLDEVAGRQERHERLERIELGSADHGAVAEPAAAPKDSFEEVDFGSYFQDYLDPGFRTQPVEPIYETIDGWREPTGGARSWAQLPAQAVKYVRRVEELIQAPVALLSTSPERDDTILMHNPFRD